MGQEIYTKFDIKGKNDLPIVFVEVHQTIFGHHRFHVEINNKYSINDVSEFKKTTDLIGGEVLFTFESPFYAGESNEFKGVITKTEIKELKNNSCNIVVSGHSPTILLEGLNNTSIFIDKSLPDLFKDILAKQPDNLLARKSNSTASTKALFNFQFDETNFNFLARQAQDAGEWFFYDGKTLLLGAASSPGKHKLKIGSDIWNIDIKMFAAPLQQTVSSYTYEDSKTDEQKLDSLIDAKDFVKTAQQLSNKLHTSEAQAPAMSAKESRNYPKVSAQSAANAQVADLVSISGESIYPGLKIGDQVEIVTENDTYGTFTVVELTQKQNQKGYSNWFSAIPASAKIPPRNPNLHFPKLNSTTGIVTDNKDPKKMGRVKVKFTWSPKSPPLETNWIRVSQSAAGKGYGNYFTPEIDDEVIVHFEFGNPDMPYVAGSLFNSKSEPGDKLYHEKNFQKVILTKGGNTISINDEGGKEKIIISTPSEKHIVTLDAEKKQIEIKSAGDIIVSGTNIKMTASKKMELTCDEFILKAQKKANIESVDIELKGSKSIAIEGSVQVDIKGTKTTVEAQASLELKSSGITQVKGSMVNIN